MTAYFLDASAAVKGYVAEPGSSTVLQILDERADHELHLGRIGVVEVFAALYRRGAVAGVELGEISHAVTRFREDARTLYRIVEFSLVIAKRSVEVAERHRLRAHDCLQLATALVLQEQRANFELSPLVLLSSDEELNDAASSEGIGVEDPASP